MSELDEALAKAGKIIEQLPVHPEDGPPSTVQNRLREVGYLLALLIVQLREPGA